MQHRLHVSPLVLDHGLLRYIFGTLQQDMENQSIDGKVLSFWTGHDFGMERVRAIWDYFDV